MRSTQTESGAALVIAILMVSLFAVVGGALVMSVTLDAWVSLNYRDATRLLYIAEAGIEEGRESLRNSALDPSALLRAAAGPDGVLAWSSDVETLLRSDDVPFIHSFGGGASTERRHVFLRNDAVDGPASPLDSNGVLTLVSVASKGASRRIIESTVVRKRLPRFPAALILDGALAFFAPPNSASSVITGIDAGGTGDHGHAIAVMAAADRDVVLAALPQETQIQYPGMDSIAPPPADIANLDDRLDPRLKTVEGLERLVRDVESVATDVLAPQFGSATSLGNVGSSAEPRVVVVNGDCVLTNGDGHGVLLVRGVLTFAGNFRWTGLILVIGQGDVRSEDGAGQISGGLLLARTRDEARSDAQPLGAALSERGAVHADFSRMIALRIEIERLIENALASVFPYKPIAIREY